MTDDQKAKWDRLANFARNRHTPPDGELPVAVGLIVAADALIRKFTRDNTELVAEVDELRDRVTECRDCNGRTVRFGVMCLTCEGTGRKPT
jgi:hypothetical protein